MTHSLDSLKPARWAYIGLEDSGYTTKSTTEVHPLKLLSEPSVSRDITPVDLDVQSPYPGEPDRQHNLIAAEVELEFSFPVGYYAETEDQDLPPAVHTPLLICGMDYSDDPGVAGSEPRTTTYSRDATDQASASCWVYKLAENTDGSGNRQASEILLLGARGTLDITCGQDDVIRGTATVRGLIDDERSDPYWQTVDTSGNLGQSIPDLSGLNNGRADMVARKGTITASPFNASYLRNLEISAAASIEDRRANAGTTNAGVTDEIYASQDGPWEVSFELPQVEGAMTSGGILEAQEDTGLNTNELEVEYQQSVPDSGTTDSIYRFRFPHFRATSVEEDSDAGMGVWSVTGMAYADAGDDGVEIDIEGTE